MENPEGGEPRWLQEGRIPSLDGIRAVAVGLVLLAHAHQTRGFPDFAVLHQIGRSGQVGVEVFFVISGFLITTLILREQARDGVLAIREFYARRILRIVPAYASLLVVVSLMQLAGSAELSERDWIASMTYTVNFLRHPSWEIGHAWSLSIEEHFYLVWPLLLVTVPHLGRRAAIACMALCFLSRWIILLADPSLSPMVELWTFTRLDSIAAGCLIAFMARDERWRVKFDRACSRPAIVVSIAGVLIASLAASRFSAKFSVGVAYTLNACCLAVLTWAGVRHPGTWAGLALNHRLVASIGVFSYSIYLWQQLFLYPNSSHVYRTFPLNLVLAILVAMASYFLIERPFLRLRAASRRSPTRGSQPKASIEPPPKVDV